MENVDSVETLVLSQEDRPGTHITISIPRNWYVANFSASDYTQRAAAEMFKKETESNKIARLVRTKQLLRKYPQRLVQFMWFTDEKLLTPSINLQNDKVHVAVPIKKNKL